VESIKLFNHSQAKAIAPDLVSGSDEATAATATEALCDNVSG
jgi:hypothetical protein